MQHLLATLLMNAPDALSKTLELFTGRAVTVKNSANAISVSKWVQLAYTCSSYSVHTIESSSVLAQ